jgi:hypothetical protein
MVEETRVPGKNHWPDASHWQIWSHNVVHLTLSEDTKHNIKTQIRDNKLQNRIM